MRNLINLYYNTISNRVFEGIRLIREFFAEDGDMSSFRKLQSSNISLQEKIILLNNDYEIYNYKIAKLTEEDYINNGYLSSNGDRYIFIDMAEEVTVLNSSFQFVSKTMDTVIKDINIFIINKKLIDCKDDSKIIHVCYRIAQVYFVNALNDINNPIAISANKYESTDIFTKKSYSLNNKIFYVNYMITVIMILDVMFNFKFNDFYLFKEAVFKPKYWLNEEVFKEIFEYAIDEYPDDTDYVEIFRKIHDIKKEEMLLEEG